MFHETLVRCIKNYEMATVKSFEVMFNIFSGSEDLLVVENMWKNGALSCIISNSS
jgi:hypothetical protein